MHVLSLLSSPAEDGHDELWVTSAAGSIARLDHHGRGEPFEHHTGQLIHHVFRGPTIDGVVAPYCGIAYGFEGRRSAIGLDRQGRSQWHYRLPSGSFTTQVRFVTSAPLLDDHACDWLVAGADGSLHIVSQDGTFTDHFDTGQAIAGLAGVRHAAAGLVVISGPDGLQAWHVSPPATARRRYLLGKLSSFNLSRQARTAPSPAPLCPPLLCPLLVAGRHGERES